VDKKDFVNAMSDYDKCIEMMGTDGFDAKTGRAQYGEYPDTFVGNRKPLSLRLLNLIVKMFHCRKSIGEGRAG
jgi:hypothetical protein